ncbi:hypothetical protein E2562_036398 [Oryza meyeriana var. granulata]|uniref:Uncharacterized protein n=1 Tax=Oryza meyeriana var. granulata TaxID=110450 RepID=A0A6G1E7Q8_9ORYZ|nr:hypothetical protein E2562_036398 [Oryza meyeriana var. granulata]
MPISFTAEDGRGRLFPHNDALVITACVAEAHVHYVLVDGGTTADILFASAFDQLRILHSRLTKGWRPVKGFSGSLVEALGQIEPPMRFGRGPRACSEGITFVVVDMPYAYNIIMGRGSLNKFGAVVHQNFLCMKMPSPTGIITIRGDQEVAMKIDKGHSSLPGKDGQIDKLFQARHPELAKYLMAFWKAEAHFKGISVRSIPRSEIADTDALTKAAANNKPLPAHILYEVLHRPAVQDVDHDATLAPVKAITMTPD